MSTLAVRKHPLLVWIVIVVFALAGLDITFGTLKILVPQLGAAIKLGAHISVFGIVTTFAWGVAATAIPFAAALGLYFEKRWSLYIFLVLAIVTGLLALASLPTLLSLFTMRPSEPAASAMRMVGVRSIAVWSALRGTICVASAVIVYRYFRRVPQATP